MNRFRVRRMEALYRAFRITADARVLDVGGTLEIWFSAPVLPKLVMLNLPQAGQPAGTYVEGDACHLPFAFPVETHLLNPFVHWLPKGWSNWIVERCTVWQLVVRPTEDRKRWYIDHYREQIRLLSAGGMARLFPDAVIRKERFLLLTKSLIAVRRGRP